MVQTVVVCVHEWVLDNVGNGECRKCHAKRDDFIVSTSELTHEDRIKMHTQIHEENRATREAVLHPKPPTETPPVITKEPVLVTKPVILTTDQGGKMAETSQPKMSPYARHKYFEQNKPAIIADLLEDVAAARKKWHLSNNAAYANQWMRDAIIRSKKPGNSLYIANIHRTPPPVVSPYATRAAESANKLGEELAREQQRQQTAKPVPTLMEQFSQALAKIEKETSYWNDEKKVLYVRGFLDATLILVGSNHA